MPTLRDRVAWLALALGLLATGASWALLQQDQQRRTQAEFQLRAERATAALRGRLLAYEQVLRGGAALFDITGAVSRKQWHTFVDRLRVAELFPGVQGVGFAKHIAPAEKSAHVNAVRAEGFPDYDIRPEGERETYTSIVYLEPFSGRNLRAFGFDMFSEPVRRSAMERARDQGTASLSGKVTLVQETDEKVQAGVLMYLPVYRGGQVPAGVEERRAMLIGFVYAPFRMNDLGAAALDESMNDIDVEIFDGATATTETLLMDRDGVPRFLSNAESGALSSVSTIDANGRKWTLKFVAQPEFIAARDDRKPLLVLAGGTLISALLFALTWTVSRTRDQALKMARKISAALQENEQRFAAIVHGAMDAIVTIDEKQTILHFNPAAERVFRCEAAQAIGAPLTRFMPERFRDLHRSHVERFGATGVTDRQMGKQLDLYGLRADGEEFSLEASISHTLQDGQRLYTVILRDISERRRAQTELERSHSELRQLSIALRDAQEDERKRIARDLHDDLGQSLTVLKMDVSSIEVRLKSDPASPTTRSTFASALVRMDRTLNHMVKSVRRISADLRPTMLDDLGLESAIEALVRRIAQSSNLRCAFECHPADFSVDERLATPLYRIAQEALNNAVKHAQASEISVKLCREATGDVVLEVRDNGIGLKPGDKGKTGSFGLIGMRERIHALGGELLIDSKPGLGTAVRVMVPDTEKRAFKTDNSAARNERWIHPP